MSDIRCVVEVFRVLQRVGWNRASGKLLPEVVGQAVIETCILKKLYVSRVYFILLGINVLVLYKLVIGDVVVHATVS